MEENTVLPLEIFLKEYGINIEGLELTNKEKLEIVKNIFVKLKTDRDWEDYKHSQKTAEEKTEKVKNEYVNNINNLDIKIMNTIHYRIMLKVLIKEERKLKRKQSFQKVLGVFETKK